MSARRYLEWWTELWWMDPPSDVLARLYAAARREVGRQDPRSLETHQGYLRRVGVRFRGKLAAAGIFVEGDNP